MFSVPRQRGVLGGPHGPTIGRPRPFPRFPTSDACSSLRITNLKPGYPLANVVMRKKGGPSAIGKADGVSGRRPTLPRFLKRIFIEDSGKPIGNRESDSSA